MMKCTVTALLAGALFLQPGLAAADDSHSLEQLVIEMAKTPADHSALAKHYQAKAADARAEAAEHEAMAKFRELEGSLRAPAPVDEEKMKA